MIRNYLLVAFRTMLRNKIFSAINALGLALGLAGFWIIMQYVTFERSYDNFHVNAGNIYRVQLDQYKNNELIFKSSENYPAVGPALEKDFPEIVSNARLYNLGSKNNVVITYQDAPGGPIQFKHRRFLYADSSFLPMFSYKMIYGDAATALGEPFSMVISESYAKK
ncbi:ABC transporter permease [bacterium]|nr:ABC transporter permease [bacterium]